MTDGTAFEQNAGDTCTRKFDRQHIDRSTDGQYIVIVLRIQKLGDAARKKPFNRQASPASRSIAVRASCFPFRASCSAVFPMYLIDGSALCSSSTRHAGSFPTHAARHKAVAPSPRLALMSVLGWPSSPSSAFIAAMCG
jgi:hypothetical protein